MKCHLQRILACIRNISCKSWREKIPLDFVNIESTYATLQTCRQRIEYKTPGAYLRFGDGDIYLAKGHDELLQKSSQDIAVGMQQALSSCHPGIIKALPLHSHRFGYEEGMFPGVHLVEDSQADRFLREVVDFFIGRKIYSAVALHHQFVVNYENALNFLILLKQNTKLFIGAKDVPSDIKENLFGHAPHIKTPMANSFSVITEVEQQASDFLLDNQEFGVVVVAMGCSGRILSHRLFSTPHGSNFFFFDFGSLLDIFCGWETRAWHSLSGISKENILNAKQILSKYE